MYVIDRELSLSYEESCLLPENITCMYLRCMYVRYKLCTSYGTAGGDRQNFNETRPLHYPDEILSIFVLRVLHFIGFMYVYVFRYINMHMFMSSTYLFIRITHFDYYMSSYPTFFLKEFNPCAILLLSS